MKKDTINTKNNILEISLKESNEKKDLFLKLDENIKINLYKKNKEEELIKFYDFLINGKYKKVTFIYDEGIPKNVEKEVIKAFEEQLNNSLISFKEKTNELEKNLKKALQNIDDGNIN